MAKYGVRHAIAAGVSAAMLFDASMASSNGRFPRAARLVESPRDPNRLTIVATYGLLLTEDRGRHWYHVCDAAFTFEQGFSTDPVFGLTADESFLVGAQTRLTRSSDRGCSWTKVLEPAHASVDDFTMIAGNADDILALVTEYGPAASQPRLEESVDGGVTWLPVGSPLPAVIAYTLDVDPKNPSYVYVTGSNNLADATAPAVFLTSNDRGTTWTVHPIPNTNANAPPYIAAIHPTDGNKIFVRTDAWKSTGAGEAADDALLYSSDRGESWTEILHPGGLDPEAAGAKLLGFALSPDGSSALAGYGDPIDPLRMVDPDRRWRGIYRSSSDGRFSFGAGAPGAPTPVVTGNVSCLTWTATGIYRCLLEEGQPTRLSFTTDVTFASVGTTLMSTNEALGQSPCCGGRLAGICDWSTDCRALQACDGGAPAGPPTCGGAGNDAPAMDAAGGAAGMATASSHGCGCRVPGTTNRESIAALVLAGLLLGARRRRKGMASSQMR